MQVVGEQGIQCVQTVVAGVMSDLAYIEGLLLNALAVPWVI